jgi:uncharacterized repeat protein (TIGR03803 family)
MKTTYTLLALAAVLTLIAPTGAQTFNVIHTFEATDGFNPGALVMDPAGNLYGATVDGGIYNCSSPGEVGCGTLFELSPKNSTWTFSTIYKFQSNTDGWSPNTPLTVGRGNILYGTTLDGGIEGGGGSVFGLTRTCLDLGCNQVVWNKTILHRFVQCDDGAGTNGGLVLDASGNLYGTTVVMCDNTGQVYELSPAQGLQGMWTKSRLYAFHGPPTDGRWPDGPVVFDQAGNLYGSTVGGGWSDLGTVYCLSHQGSTWSETLLHAFTGADGQKPIGGLMFGPGGNLYGTTYGDSRPSGVFELTPPPPPEATCNNPWGFAGSYPFPPGQAQYLESGLVRDTNGHLYGAAAGGGNNGFGAIYELTPNSSGWNYSPVYEFTGGTDGYAPQGPLVLDGKGHLFGTAAAGGDPNCNSGRGCGTVWMIALH